MPGDEFQDSPSDIEESSDALSSVVTLREDAYVRGGTYKNDNYKGSTTLSVRRGSASQTAFTLLKFDLSGVSGDVTSAKLRMYGSANTQTSVEARGLGGSWAEASVTYATAPALSGTVLSSREVSGAAAYTWDVTSFVRANLGKVASLALVAEADENGVVVTFNARESGSNIPSLTVVTRDGSDAGGTGGDAGGAVDAGSKADSGSGSSRDAGSSADAGRDAGGSCTPRACGSSCGTVADGCGGTLSCGACPAPDSGKMVLGANFWRHTWGNGPIDYFKSGTNWATTTDPWQPALISDLSYAKVLRFMDWGPTNGSKFVNWSERVPKTGNQNQYAVPLSRADGSTETGHGVAYEWQIDLANRVGADFWINVPHAANDGFVRELAKLISAQLRGDKKVYVEYSNEVWNSGFYQNRYCNQQAQALGLPTNVTYKGKSLYIEPWLAYQTYRSMQVFDIFEQVFGKDNPRLVKVLAGQLDYDNWPAFVSTWGDVAPLVLEHMAALNNATFNPKGIKVNAYGLAPYWNGSTVSQMRADLNNLAELMADAKRALDGEGSGIKLVCYEGGQDGANQPANARDPAIYQLTKDAYTRFKAYLSGPFVAYTHVGWDQNYAWGLKQSTNATLAESHKYRATIDWVRENP